MYVCLLAVIVAALVFATHCNLHHMTPWTVSVGMCHGNSASVSWHWMILSKTSSPAFAPPAHRGPSKLLTLPHRKVVANVSMAQKRTRAIHRTRHARNAVQRWTLLTCRAVKQQKHNLTHVEIWLGDGVKTIGARWQKGKVQAFDSYRFNATSYHSPVYIFKSIDTWLMGICRRSVLACLVRTISVHVTHWCVCVCVCVCVPTRFFTTQTEQIAEQSSCLRSKAIISNVIIYHAWSNCLHLWPTFDSWRWVLDC